MAADPPLLLVAMKEEAQAFPSCQRDAGRDFLRVGGVRHELLISGPGAGSVIEALAGRSPSAILQVGFAGALRPDFAPGELYRVVSVRRGPEVIPVEPAPIHAALPDLPAARLVTAPAPLGAADKAVMRGHDAGDLVDMESAQVLDHCRLNGIPWTGIRVVSDALADEIPACVQEAFDGRRFRLAPILRAFITSGRSRRDLLALRRRARLCSQRLASCLFDS
ncbi:MAG: hypothetical protein H6807_06925 [Planctomycetes bacterium]|nr:hypothetical protein [Planctomycetota bacterium]